MCILKNTIELKKLCKTRGILHVCPIILLFLNKINMESKREKSIETK